MYLCPYCGTPYDKPHTVLETEDLNEDGACYASFSERCPICGLPADLRNDRADLCQCGAYKPLTDNLCQECHAKLLAKFKAFADELTEPEETDLDVLLDGNSIQDRNKWR